MTRVMVSLPGYMVIEGEQDPFVPSKIVTVDDDYTAKILAISPPTHDCVIILVFILNILVCNLLRKHETL